MSVVEYYLTKCNTNIICQLLTFKKEQPFCR